ncbi:MAG: deoxyribonuclease IV [Phycisphaerae bacterium]|nr:deoxyribonuclease IV [Phycisphaerae bacterium]
MLLGSHLSIAGGHHHALERGRELGLECMAMFLRNQRAWRAAELKAAAIEKFHRARRETNVGPVVGHASYLINLAGSGELLAKSVAAVVDELTRCGQLGVEYYVLHPGTSADVAGGLAQIARLLTEIVAGSGDATTMVLLETTAGQGSNLGWSFEQLAAMLAAAKPAERFGVCLDTCHIFAAGYDVRTSDAYERTMAEFDRQIGLERLRAVHLNDSKRELGRRVDRHEHIGLGQIGAAGLANFINDPRLAALPFILETPKGPSPDGRDFDEINIATVRGLAK